MPPSIHFDQHGSVRGHHDFVMRWTIHHSNGVEHGPGVIDQDLLDFAFTRDKLFRVVNEFRAIHRRSLVLPDIHDLVAALQAYDIHDELGPEHEMLNNHLSNESALSS